MNPLFLPELSYLEKSSHPNLDLDRLESLLISRNRALTDNRYADHIRDIQKADGIIAQQKIFSAPVVKIGDAAEISPEQREEIKTALERFIPWRKGPFSVFGTEIDAEWRSDIKWDRVISHLRNHFSTPENGENFLAHKTICDLGCNNGYFMFRLLAHNPRLVLGMDPTRTFRLAFEYLQQFSREERLKFELLGFEDLSFFPDFFDVILNMGIVYHHRNPISILENCHAALKKGGVLVLESMGISGDAPLSLTPEKKYAGMKNVYFIPTWKTLENWLIRTGFRDIQCVHNGILDTSEQRSTPWSPHESLVDFLDPQDPHLTREGYERPSRIYLIAKK